MDFSSTDDDLRDAMAWHTPKRGVAWRGMPCRAIPYFTYPYPSIALMMDHESKIRDRPKQTPLNGLFLFPPRLNSSRHASAHSVILGISLGIPHSLSFTTPHIR